MNAARAPGASAIAASSACGVTPWASPSSSSNSGATKVGRPPLSTSPSTTEACELRCATTGAPSGAFVGGGRRADVDAVDVLRDVEGERALADRVAQARIGAGAPLVAGDVP